MNVLTERHVQAIWYDEALRPRRLVTRRGSEVRVISPGSWNLGPGPDFRNAVLEIGRERRRVTGDVEVHICPADWDFHGHGADPNYRNVIAHVTWGCGPEPRSLPPGAVSVWLGRFMTSDPSFSLAQIDLAAYPYARLPLPKRPCEELLAGDPDLAREVLVTAGRHRLRMKARRIAGRLAERRAQSGDGPDVRRQVFYEEVMTALGYARNTRQFRRVAERVPVAELPSEAGSARSALMTAGTFEEWDRTACRPYNSPEMRLLHAADIMTSTPMLDYAEVSDLGERACKSMVSAMCATERQPSERVLGRGRAGAIVANVIVPFALAEGRLDKSPDWLPPEDISDPVRLTAFRLFGRDHNPGAYYAGNGLLIQGLLQIFRDNCNVSYPDCSGCGLFSAKGNHS